VKTEQFLIALYSDSTDAVNDRFVPEAALDQKFPKVCFVNKTLISTCSKTAF